MSSTGDVTRWLRQLKAGERNAAQPLWERYFRRLVGLARERLRGLPRTVSDEEDVALSAFDSFFRGVKASRFPRLDDRDDLWQVLVMIAARKACDLAEHERRKKRDYRQTRSLDGEDAREPFDPEPSPDDALQVTEELRRLLGLLPDEEMRTIALRKLEGYTNEEIADLLDRSLATVGRQMRLIRKHWKRELLGEEVRSPDAEQS